MPCVMCVDEKPGMFYAVDAEMTKQMKAKLSV